MKNEDDEKFSRGELLLKALELFERSAYAMTDFMEDFFASSKSNYLKLRNTVPKYHRTLAENIREELQAY